MRPQILLHYPNNNITDVVDAMFLDSIVVIVGFVALFVALAVSGLLA